METDMQTFDYTNQYSHDMSVFPKSSESFFGIRIGSMGYLVSAIVYCEVISKTRVNVLPNASPWLSGLLNSRGNLIPVFDLRAILGEVVEESFNNRRLFIIGQDESAAALWIDDLPEIKTLAMLQSLKELPFLPKILQHFVTAVYLEGDQIWLSLSLEPLFKALGRHQLMTEDDSIQ